VRNNTEELQRWRIDDNHGSAGNYRLESDCHEANMLKSAGREVKSNLSACVQRQPSLPLARLLQRPWLMFLMKSWLCCLERRP